MNHRGKARGHRIPLYLPPDASDVLDAIRTIGERHRWSRNKTIVELLKRAVGALQRRSSDRVRS